MLPLAASPSLLRPSRDAGLWEIYTEFADIVVAEENPGKIKQRLATLAEFAENESLNGQAALEGLPLLKSNLQVPLFDTRNFNIFYRFVFFICRESGQKNLGVRTAVEAWRLSLAGRFRLLDQWCAFVQAHQRYAISEDTWRQLLEFSRSVHEDLSNYDPEGAWPCLIDDFVDSMYRKGTSSGLDECKSQVVFVPGYRVGESGGSSGVGSRISVLPGMAASVGSKRRRMGLRDETIQADSVNCIVQRLAEMQSPVSLKRLRPHEQSGSLFDPMEGVTLSSELGTGETQWEPRGPSDLLNEGFSRRT